MNNFVRGEDATPRTHSTLSTFRLENVQLDNVQLDTVRLDNVRLDSARLERGALARACTQCPGASVCQALAADERVLPERFSLDRGGLLGSVCLVFGVPLAGLLFSAWLAEGVAADPLLQFLFILAILSGVCAVISTQGSRIVALLNLVEQSSTGYAEAQHHLGKLK
ncbi:MAG: hypothetical protein AAF993_17440 [Pseudomonadota bacterium]